MLVIIASTTVTTIMTMALANTTRAIAIMISRTISVIYLGVVCGTFGPFTIKLKCGSCGRKFWKCLGPDQAYLSA